MSGQVVDTDTVMLAVDDIDFVPELYPRVREDDSAIERYRAALDKLPPIVVARGRVLVDGFHRWQAHRYEGSQQIEAVDLGELTETEIVKESIRRNASHGRQLETSDKRRMADRLYRQGTTDHEEIAELLSITVETARKYSSEARKDEKAEQQQQAWDLWLDCWTQQAIADDVGVDQKTIGNWLGNPERIPEFLEPPESRQHFDVWHFPSGDDGSANQFGRMPAGIVENLLWLFTEPGQVVVDPFAGGGTTIDVAKRMGRRVWASDLHPATPMLPIHEHDITTGWPDAAPRSADLILLDPPYWKQAAGRYSDSTDDLANMDLDGFMAAWSATVKVCADHLADSGRLAFVVSPAEDKDNDRVVDLALAMYDSCRDVGLSVERRVIATYSTQQATGQQVEWAREHRKLLKLYRDVVVMRP